MPLLGVDVVALPGSKRSADSISASVIRDRNGSSETCPVYPCRLNRLTQSANVRSADHDRRFNVDPIRVGNRNAKPEHPASRRWGGHSRLPLVIIGSFGLRFVLHMYETGQQSNDLEAPMWIVYLAIPCGSYLMCFRFLQVPYAFYRTGELPHTDESHSVEGVAPIPEEILVEAGVKPGVAHAGGGVR